MRPNVTVITRERGKIVGRHEGHNIMTNVGRTLLAQLVSWQTIDDTTDVPHHSQRARYIGVGEDFLPETKSVVALKQPNQYNGVNYIAPLNHPTVFLNATTVRFKREFFASQISTGGPVIVKEMGLYLAASPGEDLVQTDPWNEVAFYKTFPEGILKLPTMTLEVTWELRF